MPPRFHAPEARAPGTRVPLPDEEARHLTRVLRLGAGDAIHVFNGEGGEFEAVIAEAGRGGVTVRLGEACAAAPEPRVRVMLAAAVLKGDGTDEVVRDAVMLGVATIQPIVSARTEVSLAALARSRRRDRWDRIAIASAKQCGRAVVPTVLDPIDLDEVVRGVEEGRMPQPALLLVEPGAGATRLPMMGTAGPPVAATLLVGPEGGWAPAELDRARDVCRFITLGGRTLRADAAPLVALSACFALWGEF